MSATKTPVEFVEVEVWVKVSAAGDYAVGCDEDATNEAYENDIGDSPANVRMICMTVKVPKPQPRKVNVTLPAEEEDDITVAV